MRTGHRVLLPLIACLCLASAFSGAPLHAGSAAASPHDAPAVIPAQSPPSVEASVSCGANPTCTTTGFDVTSGEVLIVLESGTGNTGQPSDTSGDSFLQVGSSCANPDDNGRYITAWLAETPNFPETGETATFSDSTSTWISGALLIVSGGNTVAVGDCEGADNATAWASVTGGTPGDDLTIGVFGQDDSGCGTPTTAATSVFLICNGAGTYAMFGSYATTAASPDTQSWALAGSFDWGGFVFAFGSAPPASQCSVGGAVPFNSTSIEQPNGSVNVWVNTSYADPPYEYSVDWGDDSSPTVVDTAAASIAPSHTYSLTPPYPDDFTITATVADTTPAETSCSNTVYVYPPSAVTSASYLPVHPTANASVYWIADVSTVVGVYSWSWAWGDGSFTNGTNESGFAAYNDSHVYAEQGTYSVNFTVEDWPGYNYSTFVSLTVGPAVPGPGPAPCINCAPKSGGVSLTDVYAALGLTALVVVVLIAAAAGSRRD
jgi:hypothetical protein